MEMYKAGKVHEEDIYDHIDEWHALKMGDLSLIDYLGMTKAEYATYVETNLLPP